MKKKTLEDKAEELLNKLTKKSFRLPMPVIGLMTAPFLFTPVYSFYKDIYEGKKLPILQSMGVENDKLGPSAFEKEFYSDLKDETVSNIRDFGRMMEVSGEIIVHEGKKGGRYLGDKIASFGERINPFNSDESAEAEIRPASFEFLEKERDEFEISSKSASPDIERKINREADKKPNKRTRSDEKYSNANKEKGPTDFSALEEEIKKDLLKKEIVFSEIDDNYDKINDLIKGGKVDEALNTSINDVKKDPRNYNYRNTLGVVAFAMGDYEEGLIQLRSAFELDPGNLEVFDNLLFALDHVGRFRESQNLKQQFPKSIGRRESRLENLMEDLDESYLEDSSYHFNLGAAQFDEENYREAEKHLKKAIALDPMNGRYHFLLGSVYQNTSRDKLALEEFRISADIDPEDDFSQLSLAVAYMKQDQLYEARKALALAFDVKNPRADREFLERKSRMDPEFNYVLAQVFLSQNKFEFADKVLRDLRSRSKGNSNFEGFGHVVERDIHLSDLKAGKSAYTKYLEFDDNNSAAHFNMAQIQKELNNDRMAIFYMRNSDKIKPRTDKRIFIGKIHEENGDIETAIRYYEKALQVSSKSSKNRENLYLKLGELYQQVGSTSKTRLAYERLLERDPENSIANRWLGFYNLEKDRNEQGFQNLETLVLNSKKDDVDVAKLANQVREIGINQNDIEILAYSVKIFKYAIHNYENSDQTMSDMKWTLNFLGDRYLAKGRYKEAANNFRELIQYVEGTETFKDKKARRKRLGEFWNKIGDSYFRLGVRTGIKDHFEEAKDHYEQARKSDKKNKEYKADLDTCKREMKRRF